jgi:hypothetical protein
MNSANLPGFTAEVSLYRTSRSYRTGSSHGGPSSGQVKPQLMASPVRSSGDSEGLLICLGACLCCGLCEKGPWQRASCSYCNRCLGSPPILTAAW